jgi:hypothetical protein
MRSEALKTKKESEIKAIDDKYTDIYEKELIANNRHIFETDENGNVKTDKDGNPIKDKWNFAAFEKELENNKAEELKELQNRYAEKFDAIDVVELEYKSKVEEELAKVMKELVDEFKNYKNPNSYLGKLREQRQDLVKKREYVETEEDVRETTKEISEIDKRIAKAMGSDNALQKFSRTWGNITSIAGIGLNAMNAYRENERMKTSEISTAANGNAFDAMQQEYERQAHNWGAIGAGVGGALGLIGGAYFTGGTGAVVGAGIGSGAGSWLGSSAYNALYGDELNMIKFGQMWTQQERRIQSYTTLANMMRNSINEGGGSIDATRNYLMQNLGKYKISNGLDIYDLGYTSEQAAQMITSRLQQRGYSRGFVGDIANSIAADALEKVLNLSNGSLGQLSTYDRYGNNANVDFVRLIDSLDKRGTLGMSSGQMFRANEFMNYQTQLLEMQKSWNLNPSSNLASRELLAAQDIYGNSLDSRGIQTMGRMDTAITNPQDGYPTVMLYDVIQKLYPNTRGNLLAIRQAQFDPDKRSDIQRAMIEKITSVYGGANTTSGYLALSQYLGTRNPNEIAKIVNTMRRGLPNVEQNVDIEGKTNAISEYTPEVTKEMNQYQDEVVKQISEHVSSLRNISSTMLRDFNTKLTEIINKLPR